MRWGTESINPKSDDVRIKTRFLWFPKKLNGETRWLEKTSWIEKYVRCSYPVYDNGLYNLSVVCYNFYYNWVAESWTK